MGNPPLCSLVNMPLVNSISSHRCFRRRACFSFPRRPALPAFSNRCKNPCLRGLCLADMVTRHMPVFYRMVSPDSRPVRAPIPFSARSRQPHPWPLDWCKRGLPSLYVPTGACQACTSPCAAHQWGPSLHVLLHVPLVEPARPLAPPTNGDIPLYTGPLTAEGCHACISPSPRQRLLHVVL